MRLIDADKLADFITEYEEHFIYALENRDRGMLKSIISDIPTTIEMNKVVDKTIDDVFDFLRPKRDNIYLKLNFNDLEIKQYKKELKNVGVNRTITLDENDLNLSMREGKEEHLEKVKKALKQNQFDEIDYDFEF